LFAFDAEGFVVTVKIDAFGAVDGLLLRKELEKLRV